MLLRYYWQCIARLSCMTAADKPPCEKKKEEKEAAENPVQAKGDPNLCLCWSKTDNY